GGNATDVVIVVDSGGSDAATLATGSVSVNGGSFGYTGAEELDLNLGVGSDTLTAAGNSSVAAPALVLTVSGGGTLAMAAASTLPDFTNLTVNGGATLG